MISVDDETLRVSNHLTRGIAGLSMGIARLLVVIFPVLAVVTLLR